MDDRALLAEYTATQSHAAFAQLVERHLPLVYSAALRITRQPALAEDVAQAVFVTFARKAHTIRDPAALPGWLYRAASHNACNALRAEKRRRVYEAAAMENSDPPSPTQAAWDRLAPLLDEAMTCLSVTDQNLIVLRYFEGRSLRDVGAAHGLSEDTAQKRIARAVDKLRIYFSKHGIALSAALFSPTLFENAAMPPPVHLSRKIVAALPDAIAGMSTSTPLTLFFLMSQTRIKIGVIVVLLLALGGAFTALPWMKSSFENENSAPALPTMSNPRSPTRTVESPSHQPVANAGASTPQPIAKPLSMDPAVQAETKRILNAHQSAMGNLVIGYIVANAGEPLDPVEFLNQVGPVANPDRILHLENINAPTGFTSKIKDKENTLLLVESPFPLPDGEWGRTYGFADGRVELATSSTNDFTAWEAENLHPPKP